MEHYYLEIPGWFSFKEIYSDMVKRFPDGAHFIEVGSWMGKSAVFMGVEILNSGKDIKFECIDNWAYEDKNYKWVNPAFKEYSLKAFDTFKENIKPLSSIIKYHRMDSVDAAALYDDDSLHFVFIDASHEFDDVRNDLKSWFPKVKVGGVIAGDDYSKELWPGVVKAVDEFFGKGNIEVRDFSWIYNKRNGTRGL